ncbi:g5441 [Coccomyxa elongata]
MNIDTPNTPKNAAAAAAVQEATARAATAAAARRAAVLSVPLWQHSLQCAATVAAGAAITLLLSRALHREADRVQAGEEQSWAASYEEGTERPKRPFLGYASEAALLALHRPTAVFLPVVAAVLTLRSMSGLLEAVLLHSEFRSGAVSARLVALAGSGAKTLGGLDVFVRELSEVALIIFIIWTVLRLKERLVKLLMEHSHLHAATQHNSANQENALERVLLPLNGLTSWLIVMAGGLSCLHVLGINVAPLLTVGGVSTILVGLSAQSVMANMIAGINLVIPPIFSSPDCQRDFE